MNEDEGLVWMNEDDELLTRWLRLSMSQVIRNKDECGPTKVLESEKRKLKDIVLKYEYKNEQKVIYPIGGQTTLKG